MSTTQRPDHPSDILVDARAAERWVNSYVFGSWRGRPLVDPNKHLDGATALGNKLAILERVRVLVDP